MTTLPNICAPHYIVPLCIFANSTNTFQNAHITHTTQNGEGVPSNYKHCKLGTKNRLIFHLGAANTVSFLKYAVLPVGYAVIVEYIASFNPTYILWNVRERSRDLR